jgi:HlyD family secretion protein
VPISSLFRENEQCSVFKVVKGVASLQSVEVGRRNDRYAELIQGLDIGEQVITHPSNKIEQGVKVAQR